MTDSLRGRVSHDDAIPRPRARRRAGAAHGRRRQGAHPDRRRDHPGTRAGAACAAMRADRSSMPTAIPRASPILASGRAGQRAGFRRPAGRHPGGARLGGGERARGGRHRRACRAIVRFCRRSGRPPAGGARRRDMPLACARSGDWRHPVVGLWPVACATICGTRWSRKTCARSRLDRPPWRRHRRLADRSRSIRSSTSTRPRTPPRPSASRPRIAAFSGLNAPRRGPYCKDRTGHRSDDHARLPRLLPHRRSPRHRRRFRSRPSSTSRPTSRFMLGRACGFDRISAEQLSGPHRL